jgi:DNA-binding beta-propeller fold protein YncE
VGEIAEVSARGAAVDPKSGHGFSSSKPVYMWDTKTLAVLKKIEVQGNPDGILFDSYNSRVWVFSHATPHATVIDAKDGSIVGTLDLDGAPEQAVTDGKGTIYVDIEDKDNVAVVDAKALKVTAHYALGGNATPAGLALDAKNKVLFVYCRKPAVAVIMKAEDGKILATLPTGASVDGGVFNPTSMEALSTHGDGTLTVIKEASPTSFSVLQNLTTMPGAKTITLDPKTNKVFTMAAEYGPAPTPPPTGRPARGPMLPDSFTILAIGK